MQTEVELLSNSAGAQYASLCCQEAAYCKHCTAQIFKMQGVT
jgi:hypothetical protein